MRQSETFHASYLIFSIVVFTETTSTEHTISVLFLISFRPIVSERNSSVNFRMWWSVRRRWIPANHSTPSFWRTKKSIRPRWTGFGFSGLFYLLFLSCLNKIFIRWTRYFLCCSITRIGFRFRLGTALISDDRITSAEVNGEKLVELNDSWSLIFTKAGWFTGAAS